LRKQARSDGCFLWRHRRLLYLVSLLSFTGLAGVAYLLVRVPLPPEKPLAQSALLLDATGQRLASLDAGEDRVPVRLVDVPKVVVDAVLAAEDKSFFKHRGVDPLSIARASWADLRGRPLQGGSTITQQYVKNAFLTSRERTLWRKMKEASLALKIERRLSKEQILERYLNTIYFGRGAYGIQAAARAYFGKDVGQLGLREGAYLAGLIRSPHRVESPRFPETATIRRDRVLRAMEEAETIRPEQRKEVETQPVASYVLARGKVQTTYAMADKGTQYFVEYVRKQLLARYDASTLYEGGLRVRTSLDLRMQAAAYDAVYPGMLDRPDDPAGALVAIDDNGHIRAMVGGRDYNAPNPYARVNLALGKDGGGTGRQPGSAFKPFVLAETVRQGYSVQSSFPAPAKVVFPEADNGKDYPVENYENAEFGPSINLIEATRNSVNTVYAQLIDAIGPANAAHMARQTGIESPLVSNVSLTLGTSEVSVLEMASAYTTFANRGQRVPPTPILEVTTADGRVLQPLRPPARSRVLDMAKADVVNYCLQQVVQRGSGTGAQFGRPLAGKTGTTQDFGDAWFVGYTPKLTAAVWMGYPEGNVRKMTNVRGRSVNGGSFPASIFKRFMQAATRGTETGAFAPPGSLGGRVIKPTGRVLGPPTAPPPTTPGPGRGAPHTTVKPPPTTVPGFPELEKLKPNKPQG
jgi:penicillin-binding protein 1A